MTLRRILLLTFLALGFLGGCGLSPGLDLPSASGREQGEFGDGDLGLATGDGDGDGDGAATGGGGPCDRQGEGGFGGLGGGPGGVCK